MADQSKYQPIPALIATSPSGRWQRRLIVLTLGESVIMFDCEYTVREKELMIVTYFWGVGDDVCLRVYNGGEGRGHVCLRVGRGGDDV